MYMTQHNTKGNPCSINVYFAKSAQTYNDIKEDSGNDSSGYVHRRNYSGSKEREKNRGKV